MFIALRGAKNGRRDTSLRWVNSGQDGAEWSPSEGAAQGPEQADGNPTLQDCLHLFGPSEKRHAARL